MNSLLPFPLPSSLPFDAVSLFPRCPPLPLPVSIFLSFCGFVSPVRVDKFIYAFLLQCISGVCVCMVWRGCTEGGMVKVCFFDFYRALAVCAFHLRECSLNNFKDLEPLFLLAGRRDVC